MTPGVLDAFSTRSLNIYGSLYIPSCSQSCLSLGSWGFRREYRGMFCLQYVQCRVRARVWDVFGVVECNAWDGGVAGSSSRCSHRTVYRLVFIMLVALFVDRSPLLIFILVTYFLSFDGSRIVWLIGPCLLRLYETRPAALLLVGMAFKIQQINPRT